MLYLFYYTECPISTTNFTAVRHCRVTFKIVTRQIDQSDCWKLTWGIIIVNIKSISLHPLLWMNVMLDFICMGFTELWATGIKRKLQMKIYTFIGIRTSDPLLSCVTLYPLGYAASWLHVVLTSTLLFKHNIYIGKIKQILSDSQFHTSDQNQLHTCTSTRVDWYQKVV